MTIWPPESLTLSLPKPPAFFTCIAADSRAGYRDSPEVPEGPYRMALKGGFSRGTPLQLALDRGMRPGAELGDELRQLGEYSIKSATDAEAVCRVLSLCVGEIASPGRSTSLQAVIGLFQEVEGPDCPAFSTMIEQGMPVLVDLVDAGCDDASDIDPEDVLFALKILAMYGTSAGTDAVIRAAARPFQSDSYWWHLILKPYGEGHPEAGRVFQSLCDPAPEDFLAISLLDCANAALGEGAGYDHPYDHSAGVRQLERWLTDDPCSGSEYAVSAVAALPHITHPARDRLFAIAMDHANDQVRLEAAHSLARLGHDAGVEHLARFCLDVHSAEKACRYLDALNRQDAIPPQALDSGFRAMAEFSQWLAHPAELGRPPDELEIVDHRSLAWPPEFETKTLWLLRYRLRHPNGRLGVDEGVGLVGSITFCLADEKLELRSAADAYAAHCYWELEAKGYVTEVDVDDSGEYDGMLSQVTLAGLSRPNIVRVIELSVALKYPQRLIALAGAAKDGDEGWVVVDGSRSRWYPASAAFGDRDGRLAVMMHVGYVLLGLKNGVHWAERPF